MLQKLKKKLKLLLAKCHIPRSIPGTAVFASIAVLVVLNLVVLLFYTNYSKYEQDLASTDEVISQLLNTLYLMQISPESEWKTIANISETADLRLDINEKANASKKIQAHSIGDFNQILRQQVSEKFKISIRLDNGEWLNVRYAEKSTAELMQIFIITLAAVVASALLFSAWSLLRFTRPLREFKRAAEQLGVDLERNPAIEYGPSIVKETAFAMNQMQVRIENLLRDKNLMLAAISHDLRTPITRMKLRAQFITDPDQSREMQTDLDEMDAMIEQILAYTKDVAKTEEIVALDLVALLFSLCDEQSEQGFDIECSSKLSRLPYMGRSLALKRALSNVINNAVKYAKKTQVDIKQDAGRIIITILDNGPGIPSSQLDKVFTAFYRVDNARTACKGGAGLGLAIAQDIIHAHKGSIKLANREEGGLQVTIEL